MHSPLRQPDRPIQLLVIERQRDAVVRVAEVGDDVEWARTQQLVDRVPLVVDQDLDVELPDAQRRADEECSEQQRAPCVARGARARTRSRLRASGAARSTTAHPAVTGAAVHERSAAAIRRPPRRCRGCASPDRHSTYCSADAQHAEAVDDRAAEVDLARIVEIFRRARNLADPHAERVRLHEHLVVENEIVRVGEQRQLGDARGARTRGSRCGIPTASCRSAGSARPSARGSRRTCRAACRRAARCCRGCASR